MLADLITSKSRIKLIYIFLANPYDMFHVRDLVRRTEDEINAVRRELAFMQERGILVKEPRANRIYYYLNKSYPFYFDLLSYGAKVTGLGGEVIKNKMKLGKIKYASIATRFTRKTKKNADEVDFWIVGTVVLPELALLVRNEEARLGVELNYTVMTEEEFEFRKSRRDPFVLELLTAPRVMLLGDEIAMLS